MRDIVLDPVRRKDYLGCVASLRLCTQPKVRRVPIEVARLGALTNPSVIRHGGRWLVAARKPWYELQPDGAYRIRSDFNGFDTGSVLIECDDDLLPRSAQPLQLQGGRAALPPFAQHGLEDARLIECGGRLYGLWSALRADAMAAALQRAVAAGGDLFSPSWQGATSTMALGALEGNTVQALMPLASPLGSAREKNWMPVQHGDALRFVYSVQPLRVFSVPTTALDGALHGALHGAPLAPDAVCERPSPADLKGWSGSSQLIPWQGGGWLAVAHRAYRHAVDFPWIRKVVYLHRFVRFGPDFTVQALSRLFRFEQLGIEFCAGLACEGERVVISYGVRDGAAMLLEMPRDSVNRLLEPCV